MARQASHRGPPRSWRVLLPPNRFGDAGLLGQRAAPARRAIRLRRATAPDPEEVAGRGCHGSCRCVRCGSWSACNYIVITAGSLRKPPDRHSGPGLPAISGSRDDALTVGENPASAASVLRVEAEGKKVRILKRLLALTTALFLILAIATPGIALAAAGGHGGGGFPRGVGGPFGFVGRSGAPRVCGPLGVVLRPPSGVAG